MKLSEKHLLYFGIISPLLFWLTTFLCGIIIDEYSHLSNLVSELGALGSRAQYIFSIGLIISSILNGFFVYGLWKISKRMNISIIPLVLMFCYSFLAGPAIIPMPLELHGLVGIPFPLIMFAPLAALVFWRNNASSTFMIIGALLSLIIMLLGFLIYTPEVLPEHFGLKQRFLYFGWTVWSCTSALWFFQLRTRQQEPDKAWA